MPCSPSINFYHNCAHVTTVCIKDPNCNGGYTYDNVSKIPSDNYQVGRPCNVLTSSSTISKVITSLEYVESLCPYCQQGPKLLTNYDVTTLQRRRNLWHAVIAEYQERSGEPADDERRAQQHEEEAHNQRRAQRRREWYADYKRYYAKQVKQGIHFLERTYIYDPDSTTGTALIPRVHPATLDLDDICAICLSPLNRFDPRWLPCGHILHFHCIKPRFGKDDEKRDSCPHPLCRCEFKILRPITWDDPVTCHMPGAKRRVHIFGYIRFEMQRLLAEALPYPQAVVLEEGERGVVEYRRYVDQK